MKQTWKGAIPAVLAGGIGALLLAFLQRANLPVSGPRVFAGALLILAVLGCALAVEASRGFITAGPISKTGIVMGYVLGAASLAFGIITLITGSEVMLTALIGITLGLWVVTALQHAFGPVAFSDKDLHSLIERERGSRQHS